MVVSPLHEIDLPWPQPLRSWARSSVRSPRSSRSGAPGSDEADDRRRQLVGIGLSKIIDTPIQDLSMDQIAARVLGHETQLASLELALAKAEMREKVIAVVGDTALLLSDLRTAVQEVQATTGQTVPTEPAAPALFSATVASPRISWVAVARIRMVGSTVPPGP